MWQSLSSRESDTLANDATVSRGKIARSKQSRVRIILSVRLPAVEDGDAGSWDRVSSIRLRPLSEELVAKTVSYSPIDDMETRSRRLITGFWSYRAITGAGVAS